MTLARGFLFTSLLACAACADEPDGPPPLAVVPGELQRLAVNDSSIFAIDARDGSLVEIGRDGVIVGPLPTNDVVLDVVAHGDWVAWIETEGTGAVIRKRAAGGTIDSLRTLAPHIVASDEGVFYSDTGLVASWATNPPTRIATLTSAAAVIGVDVSYVYTVEAGATVAKYPRGGGDREDVMAGAEGATVHAGQLAYRTGDGIRLRDLFTTFDRVVGAPPASYTCELLIAGTAVMCGKYRALDGTLDELLRDPVGGYAALGRDLFWVRSSGGTSSIYQVDAEAKLVE